jgi:hypothetical protein
MTTVALLCLAGGQATAQGTSKSPQPESSASPKLASPAFREALNKRLVAISENTQKNVREQLASPQLKLNREQTDWRLYSPHLRTSPNFKARVSQLKAKPGAPQCGYPNLTTCITAKWAGSTTQVEACLQPHSACLTGLYEGPVKDNEGAGALAVYCNGPTTPECADKLAKEQDAYCTTKYLIPCWQKICPGCNPP